MTGTDKIREPQPWGRSCWTAWVALLFLIFAGCASRSGEDMVKVLPDTSLVPAMPAAPSYVPARPADGSLWTANHRFLLDDAKAAYIGDTVIVDIVESSSSKMDVNSDTARSTSMSVGVPTLNMFGHVTHLGGGAAGGNLVDTSFDNAFSGQASSDRSGQVTASISARITEVLPNGNLSIFGQRAMKVDNEVQYIMVSGIIRPEDISSDNRVESTTLADAHIEYYGKGTLADKQKPGWFTRIVDNISPW